MTTYSGFLAPIDDDGHAAQRARSERQTALDGAHDLSAAITAWLGAHGAVMPDNEREKLHAARGACDRLWQS